MNMARGSGMIGFLSMRFLDENNLLSSAQILRPILSFTKKEIEQFCDQFEIPYVIDQTNLDQNTSLRNKIRLGLLPQFMDMSHKSTDVNCTFFESMRQIYADIEKIEQTEDI
jgi:tRNA(Ile)-lysidine synthase TilS/MesJ